MPQLPRAVNASVMVCSWPFSGADGCSCDVCFPTAYTHLGQLKGANSRKGTQN